TQQGARTLTADKIFINAGTRASVPGLPGIDGVPFLNNKTVMELDSVPEHLLVLGGGYIGLEFGHMFLRFGSRVTIIQSGPRVLATEDSDVADEVTNILRQDGIEILLNAKAERVSQVDGKIRMDVQLASGKKIVEGTHLLVATGRIPNSDWLDAKTAGL